MQNKPRLYYVPGMISLLVLPILLMIWATPFKQQERVLEVAYPTSNRPCHPDVIRVNPYDTSLLSLPENRRHFIEIKMNGDAQKVKDQLMFLRYGIRHLKQTTDTINGLHVVFGDSTTYETMIKCFDILDREDHYRFMPFRNHIWILADKYDLQLKKDMRRFKRKTAENIDKGNRAFHYWNNRYDEVLLNHWYWLVCWLILALLSIRLVWKRNR